jgi:hypothetical protein
MNWRHSETHPRTDRSGGRVLHIVGNGNGFTDLNLDEREEHLTNTQMVGRNAGTIAADGVTPGRATAIAGVQVLFARRKDD